MWDRDTQFSDLVGKTITSIYAASGMDEVNIICSDGSEYKMGHYQDCCESVYIEDYQDCCESAYIEDIIGDINDLIGTPITMAECVTQHNDIPEGVSDGDRQLMAEPGDERFTWTFYKLATMKGYVTIRWYGESNGYYSEEVDFYEVIKDN